MLEHVPRKTTAAAFALIAVGIVLGILGEDLLSLVVGGLGGVLVTTAAFYTVGRSEDVGRERGEL